MGGPRGTLKERFWRHVDKTPGHGPTGTCWPWKGCTKPNGYGSFRGQRRTQRAHRVAWSLIHGKIPNNKKILHKCDFRSCCRPGHLKLGTQRQNILDMIRRGRRGYWDRTGSHNPNSRLDDKEVLAIAVAYAKGDSLSMLRARFKVSNDILSGVVTGRSYTGVERQIFTLDGRGRGLPGSSNPAAKLTKRQVLSIRTAYKHDVPALALARTYRMSIRSIFALLSKETYSEVQ